MILSVKPKWSAMPLLRLSRVRYSRIPTGLLSNSLGGGGYDVYARALLKRGHVVFDELKQGIQDIEFLANPKVGEVRVGCPESMAAGFVSEVIDRLSRHVANICKVARWANGELAVPSRFRAV